MDLESGLSGFVSTPVSFISTSVGIFLLKFGFIFLISIMLLITAFDLGF